MSNKFLPRSTEQTLEIISKNYSQILKRKKFYLAGGTALAFTLQYRVSYDLDFFTDKEFDPDLLLKGFENIDKSNIQISEGTLKFNFNSTALSFFYYPYTLISQTKDIQEISIASVLDIALMKITAVAGRAEKKDFYDLYYAILEVGSLKDLLNEFQKKYPNTNMQHYLKSIVYFDEAENSPNPNFIKDVVTWDELKNFFKREVKLLINND